MRNKPEPRIEHPQDGIVRVTSAADAAAGMYGYSHTMGGYDGGQAEYVRVPFIGVETVPAAGIAKEA